jgi:Transglycosylase SLT domain
MHRKLLIGIAALASAACWTLTARAAEQFTLANGFALRCDHHALVEGRVRLYLSTGEDSYIEFSPSEIATIESVPDPPATPVPVTSATSPVPSGSAQLSAGDLRQMLARAGTEHNIDVDLLASVVKTESDGNAHAVSHAGAEGLMQLMPATAASMGVKDSFQPDQNVRGGTAYLDALLTRYHDNLSLALAAYNAGPAAVDKYHGIPPYTETQVYVARVIHEFNRRVLAREAQAHSTTGSQPHQK